MKKLSMKKRILSSITAAMMTVSYVLPTAGVINAIQRTDINGQNPVDDVVLLVGNNSDLKGGSVKQTIENADSTYAMGIASQFCVFLEGDFEASESDAEGRVAVGGNLKATTSWQYAVGLGDFNDRVSLELLTNNDGFAQIVVGNDSTITNIRGTSDYGDDLRLFEDGYYHLTRDFVVGSNYATENVQGDVRIYNIQESEFIDFTAEFDKIEARSNKLSEYDTEFTVTASGNDVTLTWDGTEEVKDVV